MKFFIRKLLRKVADKVEDHDNIISLFGNAVKGKSAIHKCCSFGTLIDNYNNDLKLTTENDAVTMYSNECTGESRLIKSTRCKHCEDVTHKLKSHIHQSLPVGMNESTHQMNVTLYILKLIGKYTTLQPSLIMVFSDYRRYKIFCF